MRLPKHCSKDCPLLLEGNCTAECRNYKQRKRTNSKPQLLYIKNDGNLYVQMTQELVEQANVLLTVSIIQADYERTVAIKRPTHVIVGTLVGVNLRGVTLKDWRIDKCTQYGMNITSAVFDTIDDTLEATK